MKRRELLAGLAAAAIAEGCTSQRPGSVQQSQVPESQARYTNQIALPEPRVAGTVSLEEAIERRRSMRRFGPGVLAVGTVGQLLWAGQGVTSPDGKRAAPSAERLDPLREQGGVVPRPGQLGRAHRPLAARVPAGRMATSAEVTGVPGRPCSR